MAGLQNKLAGALGGAKSQAGAALEASGVAEKASAAAGAVKSGASAAAAKTKEVATVASEQFDRKKREFKRLMEIWLKSRLAEQSRRLVDLLPGLIKGSLADPDMPRCIARTQDWAIDAAWPDFREEILWEVAVMIDGETKKEASRQLDNSPAPDCIRAFLRYHIYPCDKKFWGKLRDPVWLFFTLGCLVPVSGVYAVVFALLFLIIDKKDEYQLIFYILGFKGCQFLSHGIIRTILGYWLYVACVTVPADERGHSCHSSGPGTSGTYEAAIGGWLLQIIMVFLAWLLLPCSTDKGRAELQGSISFQHSGTTAAGGYIRYFMIYDLVCFILCVAALVGIVFSRPQKNLEDKYDDWPVKHAAFACQVVYGYLSMPFFLFMIPILTSVLTHSVPTAYDREGRCCRFVGPPPPPEEEAEKKPRLQMPELLNNAEAEKLLDKVKLVFTGGSIDLDQSPNQLFGSPSPQGTDAPPERVGASETGV